MSKMKLVIFLMFALFFTVRIHAEDNLYPIETPSEDELQNQELLAVIQQLMQANEDCQLPCFWSFVPGISSVAEIQDFWGMTFGTPINTTLAEDGRIFASFWTDFVPQNGHTDISITMTFSDEVLALLKVTTSNTSIWLEDGWLSLPNVLQELSDDNEFFIGVRVGNIFLILVNAEANIMILKSYQLRVRGNTLSSDVTEPLLLCPTENNLIYSSLWSLDDEIRISIDEILSNQVMLGSELALYQPVEFMTNLSSDEFSESIQENPDDCIEMLSYSELLELGYGF